MAAPGSRRPPPRGAHDARPTVSAFYVPWDEAQRRLAAQAHVSELDQVVPAAGFVTGPNHDFRVVSRSGLRRDHRQCAAQAPGAADGAEWERPGLGRTASPPCCTTRRQRARLIGQVERDARGAPGRRRRVRFRGAAVRPRSRDYKRFLFEIRRAFAPRGLSVGIAVPVADETWKLADYARVTDKIYLMLYDEHWSTGDPGPVASQTWFVQRLVEAVRAIGPDKAVAAIANYGFDWARGQAGRNPDDRGGVALRPRQRRADPLRSGQRQRDLRL